MNFGLWEVIILKKMVEKIILDGDVEEIFERDEGVCYVGI